MQRLRRHDSTNGLSCSGERASLVDLGGRLIAGVAPGRGVGGPDCVALPVVRSNGEIAESVGSGYSMTAARVCRRSSTMRIS